MAKISGIDNLDDNTEKRLQAYQQYYTYMQNNQPSPASKVADSSTDASADATEQDTNDLYQKTVSVTGAAYDSKGRRTIDFTAYTKTKFVSQSPPDVTAAMSSQLFNSLDEDKDHLLESDEYSRSTSLSKAPPKSNEVSDL